MHPLASTPNLVSKSALIALALALALILVLAAPASASRPPAGAGKLTDVSGLSAKSAQGKMLNIQGFSIMRTASGQAAMVDRSMADQGVTTAAAPNLVDISGRATPSRPGTSSAATIRRLPLSPPA